jgi:hypothetical protein
MSSWIFCDSASSVLPMSPMMVVPTDESSRLTISAATRSPPSAELEPLAPLARKDFSIMSSSSASADG